MESHLVIVESPAKAKTIKRFLGEGYTVQASMGHVRDLPASKLSVDTDAGFEPTYEVPSDKKAVVKKLKTALKDVQSLWVATDEDREGEAIGWHLLQVLKPKKDQKVHRIVFHEITREAIEEAIKNPRTIDMRLVEAQQARRVLDRLVGYTLSPFLWKKVYRGLSAGRVQSVAVRIIVDREREIQAFHAEEYWSLDAQLRTKGEKEFTAELRAKEGKKFVPGTKEEMDGVLTDLKGASFAVESVEEKEVRKTPPPPFTTSTLQQEAARKLGFSVKQTMVVAQQLYEGIDIGEGQGGVGLITYMRTDSVFLSEKALTDAKQVIEQQFGREYILSTPRRYKTKSKGAQEAHEAIRPTEMARTPLSLKGVLDTQQWKLYALIWNRTIATQMPPAELKRVGADIRAAAYTFRATGQTVTFDGYFHVYTEGRDESDDARRRDESGDGEKHLPPLRQGDALACDGLAPEQHFTKPPPRYTEASLVKKMEEEGIGRPSTYAPTISTIQQRGYIRKDGKQLVPEDIAFKVIDLLKEHFSDIVSLSFTANMEQSLDDIAEGSVESKVFLGKFYGPFKTLVESKTQTLSKGDVLGGRVLGNDPRTGEEIIARSGRFGPYVQRGRPKEDSEEKLQTASLPTGRTTEDITLEEALGLLQFPKHLGEIHGEPVTVLLGRYGPYMKVGDTNVSLPKDKDPSTVVLEDAETYLAEHKENKKRQAEPIKSLGKDPNSGGEMQVKEGRYGPYVTDGKTNVSLPKNVLPEDVDNVLAAQLLDKKRNSPKRKWGKRK